MKTACDRPRVARGLLIWISRTNAKRRWARIVDAIADAYALSDDEAAVVVCRYVQFRADGDERAPLSRRAIMVAIREYRDLFARLGTCTACGFDVDGPELTCDECYAYALLAD